MASASKTPNLNLPQWVGTEKPERTDFNAAFDAIDTTVASHADKVIEEFGSNADGEWVRWGNGRQECETTIYIPALNPSEGGREGSGTFSDPYRSPSLRWDYPQGFIERPRLYLNIHAESGASRRLIVVNTAVIFGETNNFNKDFVQGIQVVGMGGLDAYSISIFCKAVGKWK